MWIAEQQQRGKEWEARFLDAFPDVCTRAPPLGWLYQSADARKPGRFNVLIYNDGEAGSVNEEKYSWRHVSGNLLVAGEEPYLLPMTLVPQRNILRPLHDIKRHPREFIKTEFISEVSSDSP